MTNPYYNRVSQFIPDQVVRSSQVEAELNSIVNGFQLLGDPALLGNGGLMWGADTGTADNYVYNNGATSVLVPGQIATFKPANTSTGPAVISVNGGVNRSIVRNDGTPLKAGDLIAGIPIVLIYDKDNTRWAIVGMTERQAFGDDPVSVANLVASGDVDAVGALSAGPDLSGVRPFKMGFTEWPYDFTGPAYSWTYEKINAKGDIVAHHLKDGLPWDEAYANDATYPAWVETHINDRVSGTGEGKDVFLTIDSLDQTRRYLIGEFGDEGQEPRSAPWDTRDFDDPEVITAYSNYAINIINRFDSVTHFCYGAEVSELYSTWEWLQEGQWNKYLIFAAGVYTNLKAAFPDLKVMCTMVLKTPGTDEAKAWAGQFARIANYTDVAGVSIYPYAFFTPLSDIQPDELPANWLTQIQAIAPGKPVAIAETGWIAENISVPSRGLTATSTPAIQNEYLQKLLNELLYLNAEFVIWWCIADFDDGWDSTMSSIPAAADALIWKDIGLYDGDQQERTALTTWETWLAKELATPEKGAVNGRNLNITWSATVGSLTVRGNIATDTVQVNSSIIGRSFFALEDITTAQLFTDLIYNYGPSTFLGNVTVLAALQAENLAATELITTPNLVVQDGEGTGVAAIDNIVAGAMTVANDDEDAQANVDILNARTVQAYNVTSASINGVEVSFDYILGDMSLKADDGEDKENDIRLWASAFSTDVVSPDGAVIVSATTVDEPDPANNGDVPVTINLGDLIVNNSGEIFFNLSTTPGTTGSFYKDASGFVKVAT